MDQKKGVDKYYQLEIRGDSVGLRYWVVEREGNTGSGLKKAKTTVKAGPMPKEAAACVLQNIHKIRTKQTTVTAIKNTASGQQAATQQSTCSDISSDSHMGWIASPALLTAADVVDVKWQYWVDDGIDGKSTGWHDYFPEASMVVENIYQQYLFHERSQQVAVRCVKSGTYEYQVSFLSDLSAPFSHEPSKHGAWASLGKQKNTQTGKQRFVQRRQG